MVLHGFVLLRLDNDRSTHDGLDVGTNRRVGAPLEVELDGLLVVDHLGVVQDVMTHRHVLIGCVKQLTRGVLDERCAIGIELKLAIAQVVR